VINNKRKKSKTRKRKKNLEVEKVKEIRKTKKLKEKKRYNFILFFKKSKRKKCLHFGNKIYNNY
jgi:hypothetical protein